MNNAIEKQLIKRIKDGDRHAFGILAERYRPRLQHVIRPYVHDQSTVEDVTQDALMRAFENINHFQEQCQFYTWLYRITINSAINSAKKQARKNKELDIDSPSAVDGLMNIEPSFATRDPKVVNENREFDDAIQTAIDALPLDLRSTFILKQRCEYSYDDIAREMDLPPGTVRSRIHRARYLVVREAVAKLSHYQQDKIKLAMAKMNAIRKQAK